MHQCLSAVRDYWYVNAVSDALGQLPWPLKNELMAISIPTNLIKLIFIKIHTSKVIGSSPNTQQSQHMVSSYLILKSLKPVKATLAADQLVSTDYISFK
jgi:hypothetical protein